MFLLDYLDASVALQSLETICAYTGEEPAFHERLYSTGNYYLDTQLTAESLAQEEWPNYFAWYGGEALADIAQIKELCVENGVELVVFVKIRNSMSAGMRRWSGDIWIFWNSWRR